MKNIKKQLSTSLLIIVLLANISSYSSNLSVIPQPAHILEKKGHFHLSGKTLVQTDARNEEIGRLAMFFCDNVALQGGPPLKVNTMNGRTNNSILFKLGLDIPDIGEEGYLLTVDRNTILLEANTTRGIFYGIQTLLQLLPLSDESAPDIHSLSGVRVKCLSIKDYPRFPYRGLHLDVCRHFFPVEFVKEYIELLSIYKMNTFHWHLTDDQGWRIEIKKYPNLTLIGAMRKGTQLAKSDNIDNQPYGGYYTQDQIRDVVRFAADHYVNIIPEIEMPGHAVAALTSYPQFSCTGGPFEVKTMWGVFDDIFCAGNDSTFIFIQDILTEVMQLFPYQYIHIGGDEAPKTRWAQCPLCQKRIKDEGLKDENELQSYFIRRVEKYLSNQGRKIIGWDEILEGGLAPQATIMSWRGFEGGIEAAKQGHDVIMTPGSHCYFDHLQADPSYEPLAIGGYTTLKKVYSLEPIPEELKENGAAHILGAQGNLWTEYIEKGSHATYMAYPRAIALAEVDWSPSSARDWEGFINRLERHFLRLDKKGVNYCKSLYDINIHTVPGNKANTLDVSLTTDWKDIDIRYTTDGSDPGIQSSLFKEPFPVNKTSVIRTTAFKGKTQKGRINEKQVWVHKAFGKKVELTELYSDKYPGQGVQTVTDGLKGSLSFRAGEWQGYHGNDFIGIIDLEEITSVNSITANFMKNIYSWIHLPKKVEFFCSVDGQEYRLLGTVDCIPVKNPGIEIKPFILKTEAVKARFIKVHAYNNKVNPPWHDSAGLPCWIFIDEIMVE